MAPTAVNPGTLFLLLPLHLGPVCAAASICFPMAQAQQPACTVPFLFNLQYILEITSYWFIEVFLIHFTLTTVLWGCIILYSSTLLGLGI